MKPIEFLDSSMRDIEAAQAHYHDINPALATQFGDRLLHRLQLIQLHPRSCRKVMMQTRRANLEIFPYALFYQEDACRILVQAVLHQSRNPGDLKRRLS
ncbi:MAG: ParE toxin of type toxin-antitoxin system, parDE [Verrucomicrobiota bacterium]|jgi:plasmid stabilization system protein ParE